MHGNQVLVIDDDRAFRIENYLEEEGLEPVRFYDCESALDFLRAGERRWQRRPLAAFVDMALPLCRDDDRPEPLAGMGLMRAIREISPRTKLIPITGRGWAIEGKSSYAILEQAGDLGMLGWITKPASQEKVHRLIATLKPESWFDRVFEFKKPLGKHVGVLLGGFAFLAFAAAWCLLSYGGVVEEIFLPSPTKVGSDLVDLFNRGFLHDIGASVLRVMGGFVLAAVISVPLGILMGSFRFIDALVSPFCAFVRYMPAAAFIPLIILWLGIGHGQKIAIIFLGIFFYMLVLIASEVASVRQSFIETAYTLGATKRQVLLKVVAPAAVPGILESLRAMAGAAWTYLIVAELVAAQAGIGYRIIEAQRFLQTGRVIAGILVIGVIGIVTDVLFRGLIRTLAPWRT